MLAKQPGMCDSIFMTITEQDFEALRLFLREELATKNEFAELRAEVTQLSNDSQLNFDGVLKKMETLEQEYLAVKEAVRRLEAA